jgi:hypothetical protein
MTGVKLPVFRGEKPKRRVQPQYSYVDQGKKKLSVPVDHKTDRRLSRLADEKGKSKAAVAAEILASAL